MRADGDDFAGRVRRGFALRSLKYSVLLAAIIFLVLFTGCDNSPCRETLTKLSDRRIECGLSGEIETNLACDDAELTFDRCALACDMETPCEGLRGEDKEALGRYNACVSYCIYFYEDVRYQ